MVIDKLILDKRKKLLIEGIILFIMGIISMPIFFIVANVLYLIFGFILTPTLGFSVFSVPVWLVYNSIFIILAIVDITLHPDEEWVQVKFTLASAFKSESAPVIYENIPMSGYSFGGKGIFGGMPLMTNMGNPGNWYKQAQRIANAFTNLTLAGPRKIKEALPFFWLYFKVNNEILLRLNSLIHILRQQGGEYILSDKTTGGNILANAGIVHLAVQLGIIYPFKKIESGIWGVRIADLTDFSGLSA